ncbi:MAG TPA: cytochrome c biogenesis protein CcsA [Chthoniobacterales bacterium]|jgi:ABC-type transport system involved in cytochrome c biogenesis permease subunit|nr:cytochrome c biogenesis protein CcsA [Chthoniobacterales bacterium]
MRRPIFIWLVLAAASLYAISPLFQHDRQGGFEMEKFGRLPVLLNGRIKPLDTVARNSLLIIHGKQTLETEQGTLSPIDWLVEVLMKQDEADLRKIFVIRNSETLSALGWKPDAGKYFSFREFIPHLQEVQQQAALAEKVDTQLRSPFQRDILKLFERLTLYHRLSNTVEVTGTVEFKRQIDELVQNIHPSPVPMDTGITAEALQSLGFLAETGYFFAIPPFPPNDDPLQWRKMGESLLNFLADGKLHPAVNAWAGMATAYAANDPGAFNRVLDNYSAELQRDLPRRAFKARIESTFNQLQPFYSAMVIYVLIFVLACASWLVWPETLGRYAFALLVFTFVIHSAGLITRMYLEGRPPVTNLYSSAVFIGWGSVLLGIFLERFFRNGIGSAAASIIGFITLLIAHHLSMDGDTMEMMRAVLDTNGWLATHVVCVTLGYASTFLAGFLALTYIIRGVFTPSLDRRTAGSLSRMVYGIVCFATLFSFVGTILGGIWADQSWGRFWGWDPKENGALLIVLWNAIILHARWGGLVRQRGLMVMAVFGNIVTSWSWFGVNMLGIGLHSYGFMESAFPWLIIFCASQLAFMAMGLLPFHLWRSHLDPLKKQPALEMANISA